MSDVRQKKQKMGILLIVMLILLLSALLLVGSLKGNIKITLHGARSMKLEYGTPYEEPGAYAVFRWLPGKKNHEVPVTITGQDAVNPMKLGVYEVEYRAEWENWCSTVTRKVYVVDTTAPVIQLVSDPSKYTVIGQEYQEEGFTATDNHDGDLTAKVRRTSNGRTVTYTVTDSSGNTAVAKRTIVYKDPEAPVITLKGNSTITIVEGEAFTEPGYIASDNAGGDVTANVKVSGKVDTTKAGTYVLTYTVTDAAGNTTTVKRTVTVKQPPDITPPVITLKGEASVILKVGEAFTEPGYTASDDRDGDMTAKVVIAGAVDVAKAGVYTISYTVTDAAGNQQTVSRTVLVREETTAPPDKKVIYLTFDDGPGKYTPQLLDLLKQYNAKATFFVVNTGYSTEYKEQTMQRIVAEGHTLAIHSATHDFAQIYASEDAYFKDLYKMQELIRKATGLNSMLLRFPGGSSNTVSKKHNKGIMTRLTQEVQKRGFTYFDWNVDSGDAGSAKTAAKVYNNVIKGCQKYKRPVVLMHDIKKATIEAMEDILKWGTENGYVFAALDENGPTSHHSVNN